jgi:hypothetical protein
VRQTPHFYGCDSQGSALRALLECSSEDPRLAAREQEEAELIAMAQEQEEAERKEAKAQASEASSEAQAEMSVDDENGIINDDDCAPRKTGLTFQEVKYHRSFWAKFCLEPFSNPFLAFFAFPAVQ